MIVCVHRKGIKMKSKSCKWHSNGQLASETHYSNGVRHRADGPAVREWYDNGQQLSIEYWQHGVFHNENGPAFQLWGRDGTQYDEEYWLEGEPLSKDEFLML